MPKIMRSYEKIALKPHIEVTDNAFKITLPNINEITEKALLNEKECSVMALFEGRDSIVRKEVKADLSVSQPMAVRILKGLIDKGEIRAVGGGKNTRYVLCR